MKNILNRGFSLLSASDLVTKVRLIITSLTGNAYFLITAPTVAAVQTKLDAFTAAMDILVSRQREMAMEATRPPLEQTLDDLADNLELMANMDPVKLSTTGFDMHKVLAAIPLPLNPPQNLRLVSIGISGSAKLLLDPVEGARGYVVETPADPVNGPWVVYDTFTSNRNIILAGFPRKQDLYARACTLGPKNTKSGWSDSATILIS